MFFIRNKAININEKYVSIQVDGEEIKRVIFDKKQLEKLFQYK